jgi:hypothetical protein
LEAGGVEVFVGELLAVLSEGPTGVVALVPADVCAPALLLDAPAVCLLTRSPGGAGTARSAGTVGESPA